MLFIVWYPHLIKISDANLSKSLQDRYWLIFATSTPKLIAKFEAFNLSVEENEISALLCRLPISLSNKVSKISFIIVTPVMPDNFIKTSTVIGPSWMAHRQLAKSDEFVHKEYDLHP